MLRYAWMVALTAGLTFSRGASGADPSMTRIQKSFEQVVQPFLKTYCTDCHGGEKQEGKLDLSGYQSVASVARNHETWKLVADRLEANEMPPKETARRPPDQDRQAVIDWITQLRDDEAKRNAGDPGVVLARRLSNSEYDYTIRDLTGQDIRPTREFPVDPANEAGFDNTGESLTMSPALVKKYLAAARLVADHVVLKPQGLLFAPHPMIAETDRDKYCVQRIVHFYEQHQVDLADYLFMAWEYQHRVALGRTDSSIDDFARSGTAKQKLSPKYLTLILSALVEPVASGPLAEVQSEWSKLSNDVRTSVATRRDCERIRDLILKRRAELDVKIEKLHVKGESDGSQPLILWWNRQLAAQRMKYRGDGIDATLDAARDRFCHVFPNAFAVSSRGHYADQKLGAEVRLLTAGFHLMQGYFRDDQPLCELILSDEERRELDLMWQELNFITLVPLRQYKDFLFFERAEPPRFAGGPEFDFARPEDKDSTSDEKLTRMRKAYLEKARKSGASESALEAIETYFTNMSSDARWIEKTHREAEPTHVAAIVRFAEKAYRRPLDQAERDDLAAFYCRLRDTDGLLHEDAIRDCIVSILMSPFFCYRFDLAADSGQIQSLTDYELASRLSYFLWSSMPDDELLAHAAASDLHHPQVLLTQARRMLRDARVRALAVEFTGNWLDFRRFEEANSVDRQRFPTFTNELRAAMFEEPIRFFLDVIQRDGSVHDFLYGDHTFVNPILAKHYGIDIEDSKDATYWIRIDQARQYGRGGLLPMSVFLTKNSPGLRTSPVKRGYWVVRRLLGEHIPAPPPNVPELPADEANLGELTLAQVLARHRDHEACAGCHLRFDSVGLVFEGYGPIGERRQKDFGSRLVETKATFPDHSEGSGLDDLRRYLAEKRESDFVNSLCSKLLSYGLGRSLQLSDRPTVEQMQKNLAARANRFGALVESIVTSPQFLRKRGRENSLEQD
ncbi:MAG: Protein of unknown function (DUF1587)/Protein of unknown function (DUF1592)/Protein of unknown [Schlesneria sp.]|nr:Protein of unknown function (DUF1587)/Protein of unknown function (DUF1592)/Protein of unknown [Schlesneria sp.]